MVENFSLVSVAYCDSYDEEKVYAAVKQCVDCLGGIESYISPYDRVLVKPNFLYPADAEKCVTTHPSVIKAVTRLLDEMGAKYKCGDSPATGSCEAAFEKLGLDKSHIAPMDKGVQKGDFFFTTDAVDATAIIGVCKLKTHALERITGAVKNMYGLVCGKTKALGHVSYPNASAFAKMLVDIHERTPQKLHVMDAVIGMEGNGPASGRPVKMNLIMASYDPVALDTAVCYLINLDPSLVPTNTHGYMSELGTYKEDEIEILEGDDSYTLKQLAEKYGKPDFDVQREKDKLSFLSLWSRITGKVGDHPKIDKSKCIKCGVCVNSCPVAGGAISFRHGKDKIPVYDYSKCIRCYCCQEICPGHAIYSTKK